MTKIYEFPNNMNKKYYNNEDEIKDDKVIAECDAENDFYEILLNANNSKEYIAAYLNEFHLLIKQKLKE